MNRILVFTDQTVLAEGLKKALSTSDMEVTTVCSRAEELAETVERARPDLAIVDLAPLPGVDALVLVRRSYPQCKIVLWAEKRFLETVFQAMEIGVHGILSNTLSQEALLAALGKVANGELQFHFPVLQAGSAGFRRVTLSAREKQLLSLICQGLKNKEIAAGMGITEGSVKVYLSRLFKRVGVRDRFELALYGLEGQKKVDNATNAVNSLETRWSLVQQPHLIG